MPDPYPYFRIKRTFKNIRDNTIRLYDIKDDKEMVGLSNFRISHPDHLSLFFNLFSDEIKRSMYPDADPEWMEEHNYAIHLICYFKDVNQLVVNGKWSFNFDKDKKYDILLDRLISFFKKINFIEYEYKQFTGEDIILTVCRKYELEYSDIADIEEYAELTSHSICVEVMNTDEGKYTIIIPRDRAEKPEYKTEYAFLGLDITVE